MELLLSTMNGNMHLFETDTPYHPLRSWTSREQVSPRALVCFSAGWICVCVCVGVGALGRVFLLCRRPYTFLHE